VANLRQMKPYDRLSLYRRISLRVAPPLILLYFIAFLDRINISFASLTMNRDLGIGNDLFGLAAGVFFLGYLLFGVPSNILLSRFGARHWIAVLMVTWGLLSGSMAFVHGPRLYISLRFLVGAAEAGFFPGVILYLTLWLPPSARAGILAMFTFSIPLSSVIGAPVSAMILRTDGALGLAGWQWLFLLEALPAVLLGCSVPWMLAPGPMTVSWLTVEEKKLLSEAMEIESHLSEGTVRRAGSEPFPVSSLLVPAATYFTLMVGLYALGFWVPQLLASHGVASSSLGWMTALPFAIGATGMLLWSRWSDRTQERHYNLTGTLLAACFGILITASARTTFVTVVGLSLAAIGVFAAMPIFWASFSQQIAQMDSAVGIAAVNSLGNLGGLLGAYATGWLLQRTHRYVSGLAATGVCLFIGSIVAFTARKNPRIETTGRKS
jgi:MFS transporter, ACS family, tartrate transporter